MKKPIIAFTTAAILFAGASVAVYAQQRPGGPMMQQGQETMEQRQEMMQERQQDRRSPSRSERYDDDDDGDRYGMPGMMGRGYGPGWRGRAGMMGSGMMGPGMMGPGMMRMMIIMLDADGDGALSLEEFQAVHERMFRAMDADDDDRLTPEEMQGFMQDMMMPGGQQ